ncbi:shikimate dehydrogenase [Rhizobium vallis]|uniref:Shikimate dehydrogenase n=1 Tax=Rhizobium vallis TaxID=634290 RepID=A0A432PJC0_9HYPH|nr:shikimate dehydrogenase [Rhizobium vallis]RUM24205.1 shikimate dehydrogenase [Rhizobium vallis]
MISGTTKIFYMVAHPIHHVRTPEIINPLFRKRDLNAVMVPIHLSREDFKLGWEAMKRTRNLGGVVVSVPFKERAFDLADEVEASAGELGAANVVRREEDGRMIATNLDGRGFLDGVLNGGTDARGRDALVVGAGGAGKAIAFALAKCGVRSLRVDDVEAARVEDLVGRVQTAYPALNVGKAPADLSSINLVVNATPCGLNPDSDPLPVDGSKLRSDILVADIIMKPRETPLLKAAIATGCDIRYGAGMLDAQIDLMVAYFGY